MCGRYASTRPASDLVASYRVDESRVEDVEPSWNVAPRDDSPVVLDRRDKETGEVSRQLRSARWGLVPFFVKDLQVFQKRSNLMNARVETIASKPSFRRAAGLRRCAVPADGYYEWLNVEYPDGTKDKEAYYLRRADGKPMSFAGLYELWFEHDDADPLWSYTIITTAAHGEAGEVHDRTPFVLPDKEIDTWLDTAMTDGTHAQQLLRSLPPIEVSVRQVSRKVGNVRNNGPDLIEPIIKGERQELLTAM